MNLAYLEYRLSGGGGNSDPNASLGGVMSSTRLVGRTVTGISNVTGVTVLDAPGSAIGAGTLAFTASGTTATWSGNGATAGTAVNIGANGRYILQDSAGGRLHILVVAASLPVGNQSDTLTVSAKTNGLFDNVINVEALNGATEYRCFYVTNTHASESLYDVKIYIGSNTSGEDDISLALDLAGTGDGSSTGVADTIVSETIAPDPAVSFSAAPNLGAALAIGTLAPGQARAIWQKRVVTAGTSTAAASDVSTLVVSGAY